MKVVLDPGHGGKDPGAVGNGRQEKALVLAIALQVKPLLEASGISVQLTRSTDVFIELAERVAISDRFGSDLFVSIHINAGGGTGQEVLISGTGGRAEKAAVILTKHILTVSGGWRNRGIKVQNVYVLKYTKASAILTENGFIDSTTDSAKLKTPTFIHSLAVAHAKGICEHLGVTYKDSTPAPVVVPVVTPAVMYRIILDGKQLMAVGSQDKAIGVVYETVDAGNATLGVVQRNDGVEILRYVKPVVVVPPVVPTNDALAVDLLNQAIKILSE